MKKTVALCLAIWLTAQTCAFAAAAKADASVYSGRVLAAINTNYDDLMQDFAAESTTGDNGSAAGVSAQSDAETSAGDFLDRPQDESLEPLSAAEAKQKEAALGKNAPNAVEKTAYTVGDHKLIFSDYRENYDTNRVDLECIHTNEYCTVWREEGCAKSIEKCIALAEEFTALIPQEWALFGDKRIDADGDGKIALFFYDMNDVGGYFWSSDLIDRYGRIGSVWLRGKGTGNACDCVHLYPYADINTIVHEYQHYLHTGWKYCGKNNLTIVENELESYINEGFSGCAEYLLGTHDRSYSFPDAANEPSVFSLVNWSFNGKSYSMSYVFCQYLRTRYAALTNDLDSAIPGGAFFRELQSIRSRKYVRNSLSVAADLLYPKSQYPDLKTADERCRALLRDFWIAVLRRDDSGVYGFNGEEWSRHVCVDIRNALPVQGSPLLRSGTAVFYQIPPQDPFNGAAGSARVTRAGSEIEFVALDNVGKTLILDWRDERFPTETYMTASDTVMLEMREDYLVAGRTFLGWTSNPESSAVSYRFGSSVLLRNDPTVLYAVWEDAKTLTESSPVYCGRYSYKSVRFTPETDGYYLFTTNAYGLYTVKENDQILTPEWSENGERKVCYNLKAGQQIDLILKADSRSETLRVKRVEDQYKLRYVYTVCGETYSDTVGGNTSYELTEPESDLLDLARREGLEFAGWSHSPDAKEAEYTAFDTIEIEKDVTLYGVWQTITALRENTEQDLTLYYEPHSYRKRTMTFAPKTSGTYRLSIMANEEPTSETLDDCKSGRMLYWRDSEPEDYCEFDLSLRKGQTYTFLYTATGDNIEMCTMRMEKISDAISAKLIFCLKEEKDVLFSGKEIVLQKRSVFTFPRWDPSQKTSKKLVGWSEDPYDETQTVYLPGEKIEPIADLTLYPVWEKTAQTRLNASDAGNFLHTVCGFFRYSAYLLRYFPYLRVR